MRRLFLKVLGAGFAATSFVENAIAQSYPNKPIRIVAPLAPGGAVDALARIIAENLGLLYSSSVIVDNKPGASGHVGAQLVAKAPGDGYTLLVGTIGIHAAYKSYSKLTYNPAQELQPILIIGEAPNVVVVPVNSRYKTFSDFLAQAKTHGDKINYASAGLGSSVHMITELFQLFTGQRMNHVPYKGSGPALVELIGGQVDVMFDNLSSALPQVQGGKLRALAVTGAKRDPHLPDVPSIAEAGLQGYSGTSWFTLAAQSSLPLSLVEKLNQDVTRILNSPDVLARYEKLGVNFTPNTPSEAVAFLKAETVKWNRVIDAVRLQLD